ncbi:MAG: protoheme IX farnesyltransferase [Dehalococcoidia bacterium]|nr:protoheme IX farnesyltransferase [Dehalococcoidia bacterium]
MNASQTVRAYFALTKPRIVPLLLLTTLAAMMMAAHGMPDLALVAATLAGGALSAGAANTFNCFIDRDIDGMMGRTSLRPIPSGLITPRQAMAFGMLLTVLSTLVLGLLANWLAATLALCGLLYYVLVYSCWLKRSTPSNIVIGGAAGAVPPLVGWAAVTGEVSLLAVYLFAVIFFWTPPHFWALALLIRREYEKARIPMLPIVKGEAETRRQILMYSLWLVAFTLLVVVVQQVGVFYLVAAGVLGGLFLYHAVRLLREASALAARRLFRYSILYLALLFAALVVDRWKVT